MEMSVRVIVMAKNQTRMHCYVSGLYRACYDCSDDDVRHGRTFDLQMEHKSLIEPSQFDSQPIRFALIAVISPSGDLLQSSSNKPPLVTSCKIKKIKYSRTLLQGFCPRVDTKRYENNFDNKDGYSLSGHFI